MSAARVVAFGDLLKRYRVAAGLTQEELAQRAGLSPKAVSDLERGARRFPRKDTVALLAEALGVSERERTTLESAARGRGQATSGMPAIAAATPRAGGQVPFVGRAMELALIERYLAGQEPPLLLFAGEPGIGKSRLLREAVARAPAQGLRVLAGGCHRRSGQEPYAPFVGMLEYATSQLSPTERRTALRDCAWLVRLLPELAETLAPPAYPGGLPPEQERRLMFHAVGRFAGNVAGPAGTLLMLDDLQWAGADALDLLAYLARGAGERRLFILGGYRDTEVRTQSPLAVLLADLAREGLAHRATLDPLNGEEADALLRELVEDAPEGAAAMRQSIVRRTGGVPFYLVNCAQGIVAGALSGADQGAEIPWSVGETIRQRVAALPEGARALLEVAAVAGRSAPWALLLAATRMEGEERDQLAHLEAARQARLLTEEGADRYAFTHDLIREVTLAELSAARRGTLHRQIAQALEQGSGEPPVELLAYHYTQAGDDERATDYMARAAERAHQLYANAEAESWYRQLIERLDARGLEERAAKARLDLGMHLNGVARYDDALVVLARAAESYTARGEADAAALVAAHIGFAHGARGAPEQGLALLLPLVERIERYAPETAAEIYAALETLYVYTGSFAEQIEVAERSAHYSRVVGNQRLLAQAALARAYALFFLGRMAESDAVLAENAPLIEAHGSVQNLTQTLLLLAGAHILRGEFAAARPISARALDIAERSGDPTLVAFSLCMLGSLDFYAGTWAKARKCYEAAERMIRELGSTWVTAYVYFYLGLLELSEGHTGKAMRLLREAISLAERNNDLQVVRWPHIAISMYELLERDGESVIARVQPLVDQPGHVTLVLPMLATAYMLRGDLARADELLTEAETRATIEQNRIWLIDTYRAQTLVWTYQGKHEEAQARLEAALASARELSYPYSEAQTLYAAGQVALWRGERALGQERLRAGLAICERLGERLFKGYMERMLAEADSPSPNRSSTGGEEQG
jgi:predicted ATPase/DNA-binding XRE family transcriptional regulator